MSGEPPGRRTYALDADGAISDDAARHGTGGLHRTGGEGGRSTLGGRRPGRRRGGEKGRKARPPGASPGGVVGRGACAGPRSRPPDARARNRWRWGWAGGIRGGASGGAGCPPRGLAASRVAAGPLVVGGGGRVGLLSFCLQKRARWVDRWWMVGDRRVGCGSLVVGCGGWCGRGLSVSGGQCAACGLRWYVCVSWLICRGCDC